VLHDGIRRLIELANCRRDDDASRLLFDLVNDASLDEAELAGKSHGRFG
jgi:hypothetical protein